MNLSKRITFVFHRIGILVVQEIADASALNKVDISDSMTLGLDLHNGCC